ncbi:MAG: T9SS type A sorting domain-containing protein [Bacteroidota bacterium]
MTTKLKKLILLLCFYPLSIFSQLIPNPGFETYTTCPNNIGQFDYVIDWRNPSVCGEDGRATVDYYNSCFTTGLFNVDVPTHACGTLPDHSTGNAYAGIVTVDYLPSPGGVLTHEWSEYIQCHLTSPLILGRNYRLRFFIAYNSAAELTTDIGYIVSTTPINQICAQAITRPIPGDLNQSFNTSSIIPADNLWHEVTFDFVATSCNMEYLTIGKFPVTPDAGIMNLTTPTCFSLVGDSRFKQSYAYIDDVSLVDISPLNITFSPNQNFICLTSTPSFTQTLSPTITGTFDHFEWYQDGVLIAGATGTTYTTREPGVYEIKGYVNSSSPCPTIFTAKYTIYTSATAYTLDYLPTLCNTAQTLSVTFPPSIVPIPAVSWSSTNAINTAGTGNTYTPNFIDDAIQTDVVLLIDYGNGCIVQRTIPIYPCCFINNLTSVSNTTAKDLLIQDLDGDHTIGNDPDDGTLNFNLQVEGTLTIDEDITIDAFNLYMNAMSQIIIEPGKTLNLKNGNLFSACDIMWKGILIKDNTAHLIVDKCIIEDAIEAVNSIGGGDYNIKNAVINRCYTGIKVSRFAGTHTGNVNSTQFLSEATHIYRTAPTTLLTPYLGERAKVGIDIYNVNSINIGNTGGAAFTNIFTNLRNGIYSNLSGVKITNNQFNNIIESTPNIGVAIHVRGDNSAFASTLPVIIGSTSRADANSMNGCTYGIKVSKIGSDILNNTLNNCFYSIRVDSINGVWTSVPFINKVHDNIIYPTLLFPKSIGILVQENYNCTRLVYNNTISNSSFTAGALTNIAIQMNNTISAYSIYDNPSIHDNMILHSRRGIYTTNINLNNIYSNIITSSISSTYNRYGICIESGGNNRIDCNTITFAGITSTSGDICIYIIKSDQNRIRKNQTNNARFGIMFFGNCNTPNNMWGNRLNLHDKYISITNNGVFGKQYTAGPRTTLLPGNEFLNTGGRDRLWSQLGSNGSLSPYVYKNIGFPSYVGLPSSFSTGSTLISPIPSTISIPYTWSGACGAPLPRLQDSTEVDTILSEEATTTANVVIDPEYDDESTTTDKYESKTDIYNQLDLDSIIIDWNDSLDLFMSAFANTEASLLNDIKLAIINGNYEEAKYQIMQITPTIYAEEQLKLALETLLDTNILDSNTVKLNILNTIAYQCPNIGGEAVYEARAILMAQFGFIEFDDLTLCDNSNTPSNARRANPISSSDNKLIINETENNTISISNPSDKSIQSISIYDMQGKKMDIVIINNTIDISKLSNAMYIIKIHFSDNTEATKYYFRK